MNEYTIRPLSIGSWEPFARLCEKHNGVWGSCWCTWFHPASAEKGRSAADNRAYKERLVREGRAHASLVFDGDAAIAWCEYGIPEELPHIYHRKEYEAGLESPPDYPLTCFFVDRDYRCYPSRQMTRGRCGRFLGLHHAAVCRARRYSTGLRPPSFTLMRCSLYDRIYSST